MRIINKFLIIILLALTTLYSAQSISEGRLSCTNNTNNDDIKTVVVYVNGIDNTLDDAEESRRLLAEKLSYNFICMGHSCKVEKFYNKTDGGLFGRNDKEELIFVGELEKQSANQALRMLLIVMKYNYKKYRSALIRKNFDVNKYAKNDEKLFLELNKLVKNAKSGYWTRDSEVEFSKYGSHISKWLIDYFIKKTKIPSPNNSIFLASIIEKKDLYDKRFHAYYMHTLKNHYFSKRNFYGSDSAADKAVTRTVEGLVSYLEEHMLSGKKIVVVSHSQGNHMIELAYSTLKEKWGSEAIKSIQVVGVASVAGVTPSDTYLTWDKDYVATTVHDAATSGDPLIGNFTASADSDDDDWKNHSFVGVYMNPKLKGRYHPNGRGNISGIQTMLDNVNTNYSIDDWIVNLVSSSIAVAQPYENQISTTGLINATLRWDGYDDMDLWVDENGENNVYWNSKIGLYDSSLDRDDTDGEGPEHYTSNISCEDAQNKTWKFGIQQYKNGGYEATAHFSLRIGNGRPVTESYSSSNWPEAIQWIGKVTFGNMSSSKQLPYTITVFDQ